MTIEELFGTQQQSVVSSNIDFRTTGYESFADFMYKFSLRGELDSLNGDVVYIVEPINV